ncbi:MAG: AEC family transporter, partial [Algisphaera sp.]
VGLHNYGYLPNPLAQALHDDPTARADVLGVLFINNIGVDLAMWTLGVMVISGTVGWAGLRRAVNPPVCAVVLAMLLRSAGGRAWIPSFADHALGMLAHCAVPVALVMIGATMYDVWSANDSTSHNNTPNTPAPPRRATWALALSACVLRLGLLPLTFVAVTIALPWFFTGPSTQAAPLRSVLILHAAMPSAIFPIMLARHYDGDPAVATHVALATSAASLITMPLWISWLGQ